MIRWVALISVLLWACPALTTEIRVEPGESIQKALDTVRAAGCAPGSVVTLANGTYRERVHLRCPGVTLRGESQSGTVISAADPLLGWEQCTRQSCPGVPNAALAFRKRVADAWYWAPRTAGLLEIRGSSNAVHYWPAQDVNQGSAQVPESFQFASTREKGRTLKDSKLPSLDYSNALVQIHASPNLIYVRTVETAREGELTFEGGGLNGIQRFGIGNHPAFLDGPGEFVVDPPGPDGKRWVYVIPFDPANLENGNIQVGARAHVISAEGIDGSRVTIENLTVEGTLYKDFDGKQIPLETPGRSPRALIRFARGGGIRNVDVTIRKVTGRWSRTAGFNVPFGDRLLADGLEMYGFQGHVRCLAFGGGGKNPKDPRWSQTRDVSVVDSVFRECGAGAIIPWHTTGTLIARNAITGGAEVHGNGVSIYLYASDLLFAENRIEGLLRPVTIQAQVGQITFWRNIHRGRKNGGGCIRQWAWGEGAPGRIVAANNTCIGPESAISLSYPSTISPPFTPHHVVFNNIAMGISACAKMDGTYPNAWAVTGPNVLWDWKSSWAHRDGRCEDYKDHRDTVRKRIDKVIENPDGSIDEIRIVKGGPAHKRGIDPTPYLPIDRFKGRYNFGIRPGEPINMGAEIYSTDSTATTP